MINIVQQIRTKYEITQEELAHILGVSYTSVNAWEGGKRVPHKHMLTILTDILNSDTIPSEVAASSQTKGLYRSGAGYVSSVVDYDNIRDPFPYTHGIGRWYGSLPSFLVRDFLHFTRTDFGITGPILANFSGSGTIPLEAGITAIQSFATDINPMALLLSKLKTTPLSLTDEDFSLAYDRVISNRDIFHTNEAEGTSNMLLSETKWLSDATRIALTQLCCGISNEKDFRIQLLFAVALAIISVDFANIDKRCTNHYVYLENAHFKRTDMETRFKDEAKKYLELNRSLQSLVDYTAPTICYGDACALPFEDSSMGLVFSHPPYGTTINYYSINRLQISIIEQISFHSGVKLPTADLCKKRDISSSTLPKFRSFTGAWISEVYRVLKPGGHFIAVIGDSRDSGKLSHPFTDIIVEGELNGLNMKELFIWITNHKAGMHIKRKGNHIDHNYIIIMEKPL